MKSRCFVTEEDRLGNDGRGGINLDGGDNCGGLLTRAAASGSLVVALRSVLWALMARGFNRCIGAEGHCCAEQYRQQTEDRCEIVQRFPHIFLNFRR